MHGKTLVCVQSKVPGHAEPVLHTQWATCLWDECMSERSSRKEGVFLQAPPLLSSLEGCTHLREAQGKSQARWGFDGRSLMGEVRWEQRS